MWRSLIKNCGQSLISFTQRNSNPTLRCSFQAAYLRNIENACSDNDPQYIVPYKTIYEKPDTAKHIIETLKTSFSLTKEEINIILSNKTVLKTCREKCLLEALEILSREDIKKSSFIEYPWLLTIDQNKLVKKLDLIKSIKGVRDLNDFVPFLRLPMLRLRKLVSSLNMESIRIESGNRVYFVAEQLNVSPATVTKYLCNRLFVLEMPLEMFKTNLKNMIIYNVEPMNILKDLWGFRYSPKSVERRLKRASQAKKDKIMPWMVRCPEPILQKTLQIALDEMKVLDGRSSVAEYLGERLGFSADEAQAIMNRHPQVNKVRITKIKEVLDYLLDEEKFTRHEIAQVPRILCHSLETTKERMNELKKYGCRPSSLVIVCRSKKEYDKFLQQWQQTQI